MGSNIKNIILGIIIAFVFLLFCVYGTRLVYEEPKYEDFCNHTRYYPEPIEADKVRLTNCTYSQEIEKQKQECYNFKGFPQAEYDKNGCGKNITCNYCQRDFDNADKTYAKNLFIISIVVSVSVIVISVLFIGLESVSGGLMFGSLMYLVYGTGRYWRFMDDWLRFIILGIALAILIYAAYYSSKRQLKILEKKQKKK